MKKILEKKHSKKTMPLAIEKIRKHFFLRFFVLLTEAKSCLSPKMRFFPFQEHVSHKGKIVSLTKKPHFLLSKRNNRASCEGKIVSLVEAKSYLSRK